MSIEDKFNQAVEEWKDHCWKCDHYSSNPQFLDCAAYEKLVAMGSKILPLIEKDYAKEQEIGDVGQLWDYVLERIV